MAGNQLALTWDLIARDAASPAFLRVAGAADKAAASTEAAAAKTEAASTRMGAAVKKIALGATAGIVAFGVESVHMAADFQKSMLLVQTQAGASAAEVRKMTPAILSLAGKTAQAPEALATSLYHVESTGLRGSRALDAVRIAAEGARVGNADLEQTTNALTATIASGMLPATESYSQAMGQLNTIVGSGDMKMQDLNDALSTGLLVTVKQFGVNINDVGAALADFGDNNIRGADAATRLRMAVQAIASPSVKAAATLKDIGLTTKQLKDDLSSGGLNKAIVDLHQHLVDSGIAANKWGQILTDAFTKKAGAGVLTLVGTFDRFEQKYKEVSAGADTFGKAWAATTKSAAFQAAALGDNIKALAIEAGQHLLPAVTATMGWINQNAIPALEHLGIGALNAARWFGNLPAPIKDTAFALGALGLSRAIGLTGLLAGGVARVGTAFAGASGGVRALADQMAVQARLGGMEAASIGEVDAALGGLSTSAATAAGSLTSAQLAMRGWDVALAQTAVEEDVAAAATGRFSAAMATTGIASMTGLRSAGAGLLGLLGGPWIAGLAAAAGAVLFLKHESDAANAAMKAQTLTLEAWMKAADGTGQAGVQAAQKLDQYKNHITDLQRQLDQLQSSNVSGAKGLDSYGASATTQGQRIADLRRELADATAAYNKQKQAADPVKGSLDAIGNAASAASQKVDSLSTAMDALTGKQVSQKQAEIAVQQAIESATQAVQGQTGALVDANGQLTVNTQKGAAAQQALIDLAKADNTLIGTLEQQGQTTAQVTARDAQLRDQFIKTAEQMGYTASQAKQLADQIYGIPSQRNVRITADTTPASTALNKLIGSFQEVNFGTALHARAFAAGGYTGPGGKYEPAGIVHKGEFVVPQEAVNRIGVANLAALSGIPGYAGGGLVGGSTLMRYLVELTQRGASDFTAGLNRAFGSIAGAFAGSAPAAAGGNVGLGQLMAARYGWTGGQWNDLYALWQRESGWNNNAQNPTSTAYGIPQFLNSTWAAEGYVKTSDPAIQIAAGLKYIADRYGSPAGAWAHEMSAGWYDGGGWLPPGLSLAMNGTGKPERVRTAEQEAALVPEVNVQVLIDGQEFRGMARTVVNGTLQSWDRKRRFQ